MAKDRTPEEEPLDGGSSSEDFAEDPAYDAPAEGVSYQDADVETSMSDADMSFLDAAGEDLAAERLADLQRVAAEYANYRKRTEANRELERERAVGDTVKALLPVLDDIARAEKHGDLVEGSPLLAIASKLRSVIERLGLTPYGVAGDLFDPNLHEAVVQQPSPDVTVETVLDVVETGYLMGSTQVRVAKVVVAVPAS
ncbi:MAG: molecular chaperone GrpE [Alpinimonas sp.]|jgi:molecular chaperone GrpE